MTDSGRTRKKDWVLAQDTFDRLLACLDIDRDRAGAKYERIRGKLTKFFEWRGCSAPEDYADRTIDRVARRIQDGAELRVSDPYLYFHGVALMILKEHWREPDRDMQSLSSSRLPAVRIPASAERQAPVRDLQDETERLERERALRCLDDCLDTLVPETRRLLLDYHEGEKGDKIRHRQALAAALGLPMNALRLRVFRIRLGLEACMQQCMKRHGNGGLKVALGK